VRVSQIALQFDSTGPGGPAAADLSHRYLWGDAVDQIFADESVADLATPGEVLWPLTDHQNTVRDVARYDGATATTTVVNHVVYDTFGRIESETNAAVDHLFAYTGRALDVATGSQNHKGRWYEPSIGRWLSEDQIPDANLYRYVGNNPWSGVDPEGLQATSTPQRMSGKKWDWIDERGAHTVTARVLTFSEGEVCLLGSDGRRYVVGFYDVSEENRQFLRTGFPGVRDWEENSEPYRRRKEQEESAASARRAREELAAAVMDSMNVGEGLWADIASAARMFDTTPRAVGDATTSLLLSIQGADAGVAAARRKMQETVVQAIRTEQRNLIAATRASEEAQKRNFEGKGGRGYSSGVTNRQVQNALGWLDAAAAGVGTFLKEFVGRPYAGAAEGIASQVLHTQETLQATAEALEKNPYAATRETAWRGWVALWSADMWAPEAAAGAGRNVLETMTSGDTRAISRLAATYWFAMVTPDVMDALKAGKGFLPKVMREFPEELRRSNMSAQEALEALKKNGDFGIAKYNPDTGAIEVKKVSELSEAELQHYAKSISENSKRAGIERKAVSGPRRLSQLVPEGEIPWGSDGTAFVKWFDDLSPEELNLVLTKYDLGGEVDRVV